MKSILFLFLASLTGTDAFAPSTTTTTNTNTHYRHANSLSFLHQPPVTTATILQAGGFEWEDPAEAFDQGVENPFKNPELMKGTDGNGDMMIDPARLLGPRQGTNLYFIGMMGSGKSAVGDVVARREYTTCIADYYCLLLFVCLICLLFFIIVYLNIYPFSRL